MEIAIVLMRYNPYGGYERQAVILAEELADRGDNVTVFANEWAGDTNKEIKFHKVPLLKLMSWLKVLSFALFSKYCLNRSKKKFDTIIAFDRTLTMDIYRAGNACHKEWLNVRKKFGSFLDRMSIAINPLHIVINQIEKHIFSQIQKNRGYIVVLSHIGAKQIQNHYNVDKERFIVIPPVVDLDRFDRTIILGSRNKQREKLNIGDDTLMLLHVGSGFRIKGLESTIRSLSFILKKGIKVKLVVVGNDRKSTKKFRKLYQKLNLENQVIFVGGVNDVKLYYTAADIFVLPSLFETFCVAAIEALSCGLPVIIGKGAGVSNLLEKEKVGKVIDAPVKPSELADTIEETAKNEKKLKKSGDIKNMQQYRKAVALKCDHKVIMNKFSSLIMQVAKDRRGDF